MSVRFAVSGRLGTLSRAELERLMDRRMEPDAAVRRSVLETIARVQCEGDDALRDFARTYDGATLTTLEVPRDAWRRALGEIDADLRAAMQRAADNVARAHNAWLAPRVEIEVEPGVRLVRRPVPLGRVGVYAPGGRAAYASSVLMGVVPARVAGVRDVVVCSPASPTSTPSAAVLAAAEIAGATRLFAVGGAGAIAAMALGTTSIPKVDCIVGPGNAYVAEAKRYFAGTVRTDVPAGPSEILVIADDSAELRVVASELLAQAEHANDSAAVAVLVGDGLAERLAAEVLRLVVTLERADTIRQAFEQRGAIVVADSIDDAVAFADAYAPEHLLIATRDAESIAERTRNAGSVFVGCTSSVAFGDYMTGANHVLPTAGFARTHSGLASDAFVRWTTVQRVSAAAARRLAPAVNRFALAEGLGAHARAARFAGGME
jgi:histidinol dehydrogenase